MASSFFSMEYRGHDPGVWWLSSPGWLVAGGVVKVLTLGQVLVLGSDVSFSACKT